MNKKRLFLFSALICFVIGYFSCGIAVKYDLVIPEFLYWFFFLAIPCCSVLLVSNNERSNVFLLLTVSISLYSLYFLQNQPFYPAGRDAVFETQIVSLVSTTSNWFSGMGTSMGPELSYHPLMAILASSFSSIAGICPSQVLFIIPWLKSIGVVLFFYLFARNLLPNLKMAFFATLFFIGSVFFLSSPVRETFAEIFFMGLLWIFSVKKISFEMKFVSILLVFALAFSHHFSSYIFLFFSIVLYLFAHIFKRKTTMIGIWLPALAISFWVMFSSFSITTGYVEHVSSSFQQIFTLTSSGGPTLAATSYYYAQFETAIILLNPILISVLALPSFIKALKDRKNVLLLTSIFVFGGMLVASVFFLILGTSMGVAFNRIWGFAYIPLSIFATISFWKAFHKNKKVLTILSIVLVTIFFAASNLSVTNGIKAAYVPRTYMEHFMFSDSMVNTGIWCNQTLNPIMRIIGDNLGYSAVGSWGYKEVDQYAFNSWYKSKNSTLLNNVDYIILSPWDTVTYSDSFRIPIDPFSYLPENITVVYSSGDLNVYYNAGPTLNKILR